MPREINHKAGAVPFYVEQIYEFNQRNSNRSLCAEIIT